MAAIATLHKSRLPPNRHLPPPPTAYLLHAGQARDDLVAVALVDEEALPFPGEAHLHRVLRDERVEEGVVLLGDRTWPRGDGGGGGGKSSQTEIQPEVRERDVVTMYNEITSTMICKRLPQRRKIAVKERWCLSQSGVHRQNVRQHRNKESNCIE